MITFICKPVFIENHSNLIGFGRSSLLIGHTLCMGRVPDSFPGIYRAGSQIVGLQDNSV